MGAQAPPQALKTILNAVVQGGGAKTARVKQFTDHWRSTLVG
jgi:hypothetical protein